MNFVGIDIAKQLHFASVPSSDGEMLMEPFEFSNDDDGFFRLVSVLESFEQNNLIISLESTAHYGNNLVSYLYSLHYKVCVINPIQVSSMRKNNIHVIRLRDFCLFRQKLIKSRTTLKIQLTTYIDQLFLELQYFFKSGIHGKA